MTPSRTPPAERLRALIEDADPWRGPPVHPSAQSEYKEWQHFVVFGEGWTLLFNLGLAGPSSGTITTVHCGSDWRGHVERCPRPEVRPGRMDAVFDRAGARWRGGRYEIWHHGAGIRLEVALTPVAVPSLSHHIRLGPGAHLSWCLVPRLLATGWVEIDARRIPFEGRLAYHDHNWGRFRWGGDFSWEWGCAVPEDPSDPWTVVFARMGDRARTRTTATSLFLLRDGAHLRYFRDAEVTIATEGAVQPRAPSSPARPRIPRVPAAAALLLPDHDRDVPHLTRFEARRAEDHLSGEVQAHLRGQLLLPSDTDVRRVVRLNEVHTHARIHGRCAGDLVNLDGPGLLEVVCG